MPKLGRRSEKTSGIHYQSHDHHRGLNPPFGTLDTPIYTSKIVGGHYVPVIAGYQENGQSQNFGGHISITRLDDIAEKPTRVNPDILKKTARTYHAQQETDINDLLRQDASAHGNPTYLGKSRPDSKSINRGNRLPPIDANKNKNTSSTIFEPEVGIPAHNPFMSETEYNDKYHQEGLRPISDGHYRSNGTAYHNENNYPKAMSDIGTVKSPNRSSDNNKQPDDLLRHLWNVGPDSIPQYPIQLSDREEEMLKHLILKELEGFPRRRLDTVHIDAITADREKNGTCPLMILKKGLERQGARMTYDTLRLIASKYVDPNHHGWIYYQDLIRYLKKLMKEQESRHKPLEEYEAYQNRQMSPSDDLSALHHQSYGKLLQIAKQQLYSNNHTMDLPGIRQSFKERDTPFRGKLSEDQIIDVLSMHGVPLQRNLISRLLNLRCKRQGEEQFSWLKFCDILETMQADATGLNIPASKRPLDYARNLPEPSEQWPRQRPMEPNHYQSPVPEFPRRSEDAHHQSEMHDSYNRHPSDQYEQQQYREASPQRRDSPYGQQSYRPGNGPYAKFPPIRKNTPLTSRDLQDQIEKMEHELRDLQQRNEEMLRNKQNHDNQIVLAMSSLGKDLYGIDEYKYGSCGRCHFKEVMDETEKRKLPLSIRDFEDAAMKCSNRKGMVDIDKYLRMVKTMLTNY